MRIICLSCGGSERTGGSSSTRRSVGLLCSDRLQEKFVDPGFQFYEDTRAQFHKASAQKLAKHRKPLFFFILKILKRFTSQNTVNNHCCYWYPAHFLLSKETCKAELSALPTNSLMQLGLGHYLHRDAL